MKINPDTLEKHAGRVVLELFGSNVRRATAFLSPTFVISGAQRFRHTKRARSIDFVMKIGAPNYRECEFIRDCKKSGVAFPLNNVQLKFWPSKVKQARK